MPVLKCCVEPGCAVLLRAGGRCSKHAYQAISARIRGYTYQHDKESKQLREQGALCSYCNTNPMYHLDHTIPLHKGGLDIPENRRPICKPCHSIKSGRERRSYAQAK